MEASLRRTKRARALGFESLESILLLTAADMSTFTGGLVTAPGNAKLAYALPGMSIGVNVDIGKAGGQYFGAKEYDFTYWGSSASTT